MAESNVRNTEGSGYQGERNDLGQMHGKGKMTYGNGFSYVGEFKNDKYHGQGTLGWADGGVYEGQWIDSKSAFCGREGGSRVLRVAHMRQDGFAAAEIGRVGLHVASFGVYAGECVGG